MRTETEIQNLKVEFANFVAEEYSRGVDKDDVVRTADTVQGFIDACREHKHIEEDNFNGMLITVINESQRYKGERHKDLYILDVEEHIRLVIVI